MKSQGLPIQTIVILILVLVTLAVFLVFVFGISSKGTVQTHEQGNFAKCQTICTEISAYAKDNDDVENLADVKKFCDVPCDHYISCNPNGICGAPIDCSLGTPVCS